MTRDCEYVCFGCEYPMRHPWATYWEPEVADECAFGVVDYCLLFELARRRNSYRPGGHRAGSLTRGSTLMRARGRVDLSEHRRPAP